MVMRRLDELARDLDRVGLALRGAFHPAPQDGVPASADDAPTLTLALIGWTGCGWWIEHGVEPLPEERENRFIRLARSHKRRRAT